MRSKDLFLIIYICIICVFPAIYFVLNYPDFGLPILLIFIIMYLFIIKLFYDITIKMRYRHLLLYLIFFAVIIIFSIVYLNFFLAGIIVVIILGYTFYPRLKQIKSENWFVILHYPLFKYYYIEMIKPKKIKEEFEHIQDQKEKCSKIKNKMNTEFNKLLKSLELNKLYAVDTHFSIYAKFVELNKLDAIEIYESAFKIKEENKNKFDILSPLKIKTKNMFKELYSDKCETFCDIAPTCNVNPENVDCNVYELVFKLKRKINDEDLKELKGAKYKVEKIY